MLDGGWSEEVRRLLESGVAPESNSFSAVGYREVAGWVLGRISREETEELIVTATRGLAKRQMTWFARERHSRWVAPEEALATTLALLGDTAEGETR